MTKEQIIESGGDNIFANLGLADSGVHFLKAQIVAELYRLVKEHSLSQSAAGLRMGISQPEVSRLLKGNFREYSVERLLGFLTAFDQDVEIVSRPKSAETGKAEVRFRQAAVEA